MGSENEETMELEAEHLFLLMKKDYRISRNARAEWYFNHLNHTVQIPKADKVENFKGEIEIVSAIPQETPIEWDWDTSHLYQYVISLSTVVTFLSHTYRLVLCLDLSPSAATVDCVEGVTLLDEILTSFKNCVQGLARPFIVPGSQLLFCPKIYVTVIAHTPFLVSKGQQVLVAGWLLQQDNVNAFVDLVQFKLSSIEVRLSCWTNFVEEQRDAHLADAERIVGGLFETVSDRTTNSSCSTISIATPEVSFISILRYGMLALELLPEKSSAGIIIFTDGVFGTTDAGWSEALLSQLRHNTIACSFVQVGSRTCHPASSEGFLPNNDLMEFVASTTFGTCLSGAPHVDGGYDYQMNVYHQYFLTWGFEKYLLRPTQTVKDTKIWNLSNRCFESSAIHRVKKKVSDYPVNCSLHSVLSCRLREGFTIKEVHLDDDVVEVHLALPWRPSIQVEYSIRGQWPITQGTVRCGISVQGPYDFLHDVTCKKIQSLCSRYRQLVVQSYWALVKNLSETDQLLVHLHSFSSNPAFYTVPEAIKSGVPLFYLPPNESSLVNASSDLSYPHFDAFWKPICVLDIGYWQRWLHCHRIGILLQHDRPLPKHLHLPSTSGRYHSIQCRQAATALNAALRDFTSFVLLENHSYIGLVCTDSEKPVSFYLVRLTHKPPCVILRIAFLGGTAGSIRQKVVADLKNAVQSLNFPQRSLPQDFSKTIAAIPCCKVLQKPAEKILLRYEKMPVDFFQVVPHDPFVGQNNNIQMKRPSASPGTQWSTLSHYLHHRRWIWCIQGSPGLALSLNSVARILSIITKMRLQEGFSFAHSSSGIFTFLLEVDMERQHGQLLPGSTDDESQDQAQNCSCVVQYVLFPPHRTGSFGLKDSEDEATEESDILDSSDAQLEIVTECWVEPQAGIVGDSPDERGFFQGLDYHALAESFHPMDLDCISSLVTFEHLNLMCRQADRVGVTCEQEKSVPSSPAIPGRRDVLSPLTGNGSSYNFTPPSGWDRRTEEALKDDTVSCVPFCFQLPRLLPKCSRAKLLFSTFVQEFKAPIRYIPNPADTVNELLFDLLTRQLSQLGLREVILQEGDCRQLLENLNLQAAADCPHKEEDFPNNSVDADTEVESFATAREANSTPRSPRDINISNPPSRPSLLTPLNISYRSGINSHDDRAESAANKNEPLTPMWRCFVKSVSSSHILLVLLPASFQDLKLLMLNEEHLQMPRSAHLTKVKPDFIPHAEPYSNNDGSVESKSTNEEVAKHMTTDDDQMTSCSQSQSTSQPCSLGPTRTNSFAGQQRPRLASHSSVQAARIRAGSLDTAPLPHGQQQQSHPQQFQHHHVHASCSVGSADRRHNSKTSSSLFGSGASYFRPVTSLPSFSSPVRSAPVHASLSLPVYVFDCPLTNLVSQLLSRGANPKVTIYRDHTFPNDEDISASTGEEEANEEDRQAESQSIPEDPVSAGSINILSQYCAVVEALYCKCLGQALFTSLQLGRQIHSRDVDAAMNLCKETLLEIDITAFLQNICGHLKDFKMKAGLEILRQRKQSSSSGEPLVEDDAKWDFPLSLLRLHQPCANLKHLHKLIRTRFQEILCLSFKPVPSLFDYYFYCPPDHPLSPAPDGGLAIHDLSIGHDDTELVEFRRSSDTDNSVSQTCSVTGGRSDSASEPIDDVEWEEDGEDETEATSVPLFLHLTATVRSKKNVTSQSLNALPTCLGDLMTSISGSSAVLDLKGLKITLDFLCLTFRSDLEDLVPGPHNQRTTSFCSSSSGILDANNPCPTLTSQSELSEDEDGLPMDEDDRTESISRQLLHIPEGQRRRIKAALADIEWMLRDEIVAFMLDSFPITEATLAAVVQHVQSSPHRPSCRRKNVPLHFVLNPQESSRRFLVEFTKLPIQGHLLREEGSFYYLTENTCQAKFQGSLDPPLGSSRYRKTDADLTSEASASRSLVAQTSTDSCATAGLGVEEQPGEGEADRIDYQMENTVGESESEATKDAAVMMDSTITLVSNGEGDAVGEPEASDVRPDDVQSDSLFKKTSKRRFESGTTSIPGTRHSDSSSVVDSIRNTEDGYEGGSSNSEDEFEWLKELDMEKPKMPPFWLVLKVNEEAVVTYFHCRFELARPEEIQQWKQIHEDLINSITALGKLINQQMLLKDLHDTRSCNGLLEPETNDDIWHQDDLAHIKPTCHRINSDHLHTYGSQEQPGYLEATLKLQPGSFQCRQVWETHFPLHPRLKTGPGKLGSSKGVQQLRIVLNAFSVNNRNNMFVYQENSGNVFYLRLNESSCVSHRNPSDSVSISRYNADEADGASYSCSRRSSNWNVSDRGGLDEDSIDSQRRSGSFSERDSVGGDQMSLGSVSLNRSLHYQSQQHLLRKEDCIQLKVHGITEAGPAIKIDLVRVLQNKLDDAVLEVLHSLLSRNPACKLTSDDVHFIQKPNEPPHIILQSTVQACALPYLPALAYYLRQNLLDSVVYTPKYMDNFVGHHFQDYSPFFPAPTSDVYLYNRPQASGNRGIACIAFALVDGVGNPVSQLEWPRPATAVKMDGGIGPSSLSEFEEFIRADLCVKATDRKGPGPMAAMEFRIWERGHVNEDTLREKLELAIQHALWDVVLEYRLLPFPLCAVTDQNGVLVPQNLGDGLPCSEPTTPVRRKWQLIQPIVHEEDIPVDPRSRSVSFSGLPPNRSGVASGTTNPLATSSAIDPKWKVRHTSGTSSISIERPLSPVTSIQLRSSGPISPVERFCERSVSTSSVTSSLTTGTLPELDKLELGERGVLHPVYSKLLEKWFNLGLQKNVASIKFQKASLLAPLTVPTLLKAVNHICSSSVTPELSMKIFSSSEPGAPYIPYLPASRCPKQGSVDRSVLDKTHILIGRNMAQWKESLSGEINLSDSTQQENNGQVALKVQRAHQRFVSYVHDSPVNPCPEAVRLVQSQSGNFGSDVDKANTSGDHSSVVSLLIPRQRLLWATVSRDQEWTMWLYNFNKDNYESLTKQCHNLVQWHNARWALLSSIVAQKLGLFHNQQCSGRTHAHQTIRHNPFLVLSEMEALVKLHVPPASRDYNVSTTRKPSQSSLPHFAYLETYRDSKPNRLLSNTPYGNQGDLVTRHGQQWIEKRYSERREEMQRLLVLCPARSSGNNILVTEDIIQLFKQVARIIHYCFTPLLFLPKWRIQVARTRDPNMATASLTSEFRPRHESGNSVNSGRNSPSNSPPRQPRRPTDDHWHQSLCSAYLQEYVQYLHTLGFLQMEIKPLATKRGPKSALKSQRIVGEEAGRVRHVSHPTRVNGGPSPSSPSSTSSSDANTLYFHKSHQGGILVCEVAIQEPFFYTKVYALEMSRLLHVGMGGAFPNVGHIASAQAHYTDRFLNECDHIKVLLHLHSFTYDFHLRSLNSFVSGRQYLLKPGFHLVSFLDDFTKYYNKAPNFARNQVVSNSLTLKDPATTGEQLFNYLLTRERRYGFQVLRMASSSNSDNDKVTTEFVLAKQWSFKTIQREYGDLRHADDYDVTLLVSHESVVEDPMTIFIKFYVIMTSKREYYPRLLVEKKPGKFRTVSTATPVKAASAPPLETVDRVAEDSDATASSTQDVQQMPAPGNGQGKISKSDADLQLADKERNTPTPELLSVSNPEVSFIQRKGSIMVNAALPEENRTSPAGPAVVAAAAAAFIRQEVINYLGYYTKHEQDMQSMMSEQAKKAEDLIRAIVNQAKVHCRRDTLWQRLQQSPASSSTNLTYLEFRELLTLSHTEPISSGEPQLVPLLAQPVSWYQGLAKLLLSRYPENHRHYSSADGKIQYVIVLNQRLPGTAMMLSCDVHADKAELSSLCQEIPSTEMEVSTVFSMDNGFHSRPMIMQGFIEDFVNLCAFHIWSGLLG
uniref:Protein SZT2 n=1 Tax=Daphnia magna TaxID=35525 RepID=A0A0N7ZXW0_9CRUS